MLGKLFSGLAFGSTLLTAAVYSDREPRPDHGWNMASNMHGVRVAGARPWHPAGLPESSRGAVYHDSAEPYDREDARELAPDLHRDQEALASWDQFGEPSGWPQP